jgi:hypothetical protein
MTNESTSKSEATETRVGYMVTSFLEELCLNYIKANVGDGKFTGDVHYLIAYDSLRRYNEVEAA